jgi:hypothetical protein
MAKISLTELTKIVVSNLSPGMTFTATQLAKKIMPFYPIDNRRPNFHPYAAQISIILNKMPGITKNNKTRIWEVL